MENVLVGVIALLLFVYLFVAMIRPEKFQESECKHLVGRNSHCLS